jgi:hypothetical protein
MIADASQMLYISTISCLFSPRRGFAPGLAPERQSESKDTLSLHSDKNYTVKILHTDDFTQRGSYTEQLYTQTLFHTEVSTHRNFNAQMPKLLHTGAFAHTCHTKRSF